MPSLLNILLILIIVLFITLNREKYIDYIDPNSIQIHPDFEGTKLGKKLKNAQKILNNTLEDLNNVCIENNITYFVIGGTLLGTLRHRNWIPFDDDIDIAMFKEDIDKIIEIYKNNEYLQSKYKLGRSYWSKWHRLIKIHPKSNPKLILDIFQLKKDVNNYYDIASGASINGKVHSSNFLPTKYGKFGKIMVPIGNNPEELLKLGLTSKGTKNYNELPSINKRRPHNSF